MTYSCCSGSAGCEPCPGRRGCGNDRWRLACRRAPAEVHDLSYQHDWNEKKQGERPTASPSQCNGKVMRGIRRAGGAVIGAKRGMSRSGRCKFWNLQKKGTFYLLGRLE